MAGRGKRESDDAVLRQFEADDDPVYSAAQIAEGLSIDKAAVDKRLREFETAGLVASKKVGPSRAWWLTDEGRAYLAGELDD